MPSKWKSSLIGGVAVALVALAAVGIWQSIVWYWGLPKALLPTPKQTFDAAVTNRELLFKGMYSTASAAVIGLVVAIALGSTISIALSQSKWLRVAIFPYLILLQTVPIVAVEPLLIIWSGYTFRSVVIVTVIVCLFPIVNSVAAGLTRIEQGMNDLFDLYRVSRAKRLQKLQIPSAVNDLIIGAKTSSGLAVIGAIVAEFFVGNGTRYDGLGTLITGWQALSKTDALIAALFASAALGLAMFAAVHFIGAVVLRRWTS
jgi:NitT/TauT family transport system permease protein